MVYNCAFLENMLMDLYCSGVEVKNGEPLKVAPGPEMVLHLSQVRYYFVLMDI